MMSNVDVVVNVNIEKFRYSLVGDGYTREKVEKLSEDDLIDILKKRITNYINTEFEHSKRLGLLYDL